MCDTAAIRILLYSTSGANVKILAFDTAMKSCAAACLEIAGPDLAPSILAGERKTMSRGQAEDLVPMIARVMARADLTFAQIDRIALSIGPGTFTGLRTGLATARGLALAADKPVVGVGTLQALAWDLTATRNTDDETAAPFAISLDARRDQIYLQTFSTPFVPLGEPVVCTVKEAVTMLPREVRLIAGSGAALLVDGGKDRRDDLYCKLLPDENGPSPQAIAAMAFHIIPDRNPPSPLYLRAPDAKPQNHVPLARR